MINATQDDLQISLVVTRSNRVVTRRCVLPDELRAGLVHKIIHELYSMAVNDLPKTDAEPSEDTLAKSQPDLTGC